MSLFFQNMFILNMWPNYLVAFWKWFDPPYHPNGDLVVWFPIDLIDYKSHTHTLYIYIIPMYFQKKLYFSKPFQLLKKGPIWRIIWPSNFVSKL